MGKKTQNDTIKVSLPDTISKLKEQEKKSFIQSNEFIESSFLQPFKELELKTLALISKYINENRFSKIEEESEIEYLQKTAGQTLLIKIPKEAFCHFLNTNPTNFYKQIKTLSTELIKKAITVESIDKSKLKSKKKFITVTLFSYIACKDGEAIFGINPILQIYLQHLKSNFTILSLETISKMSSGYAIKIYQLLKQYENLGKRIIKLEELKTILGAKNLYLNGFKDFRKDVLEIATKNINEKSDIDISLKLKKNGQKVEEIEFLIKPKRTQFQQAIKTFNKELDECLQLNIPTLQKQHQEFKNYWIKSKGDIEKNLDLFNQWLAERVEDYSPSLQTKIKLRSPSKTSMYPVWYESFLHFFYLQNKQIT